MRRPKPQTSMFRRSRRAPWTARQYEHRDPLWELNHLVLPEGLLRHFEQTSDYQFDNFFWVGFQWISIYIHSWPPPGNQRHPRGNQTA